MNVLVDKIRELKYGYLMAQGQDGGHCNDFAENYVPAWLEQDGSRAFLEENLVDALKGIARKQWSEKLSSVSDRQNPLLIDGAPAPVELRYRDKRPKELRVPGGYITVLTEYAKIQQFFWAWEEVQRNANAQVVSASKTYEMYLMMLDRANGDEMALVVDCLDAEEV